MEQYRLPMEDKRIEKRKEFFNPIKDNKAEREKFMVELRKKKKQELFRNKRIMRMEEEAETELSKEESKEGSRYISGDGVTTIHKPADFPLNKYRKYLESIVPILYTDEATEIEKLESVRDQLKNNSHQGIVYLALLAYIRECLCRKDHMFNELFLQIDFIPNLLYFTNADPYEDLLIEMTWILTNITSSDSEDVINTLMDPNKNGGYDVTEYLLYTITQK